ncbi:major facilitator superfamily domain-containing protein [Ilyonectria sp. MPI-CAGE-AT-0026]|nr:major facilitator superfamily domain-containing protein [Ilyonectria sp. MPI-CAGE-AT-0026]
MNSDVETAVNNSLGDQSNDKKSDTHRKPTSLSVDPNVVSWEPNDPEHPMNWPRHKRALHIVIISFMTLTVNLAATLFAPAAADLAHDFSITDSKIMVLTVSVYMLGFAIGPLLVAPMSELHGRFWIYNICNVCFLTMNIGCAAAPNLGGFLACRFFAGAAGSAPVTIGGGTIADVTKPETRGKAMAGFALGPLLGPVLGPVIGGFVAADLGWRWTLWIISILSGINLAICAIFMRETYAPVILARRVARLRKETANPDLQPEGAKPIKASALLLQATTKALRLLFTNPIVSLLSLFNAFTFGLLFLLFTTFPSVFVGQYNFSTSTSGLSYLGLGIGMILGLISFGITSDRIMTAQSGPPKPENRLIPMIYVSPVFSVGVFWYGWAAEYRVHWIVPIIGSSFIGLGILFVLMPSQIYVVDIFGANGAASALAALLVFRCFFAAFMPLAGPPMYEDLGLGWGNSVLGFIAVVFIPVPIFFYKYGETLRKKFYNDS